MSTATSFPISATNYDYNKRIQSQNPEKYVGLETAIFDNHYIQTWTERGVYYASFGSLTGGRDKQFYYFRNKAACNQWVQRTYRLPFFDILYGRLPNAHGYYFGR